MTLEILTLLIISVESVLDCLEEFQIHTDDHPINVQLYPKNESEIISLTVRCCQISSIYEYNYTFENCCQNGPESPRAFKNLPKLKRLNFSRNKMTKIPKVGLADVGSTEKLILSFNEITEVDEILGAEEIHLDYNPIKMITVPFDRVKVLNLSGTALDTVMPHYLNFKYPEKLQKLNLAHSNISRISLASFWQMSNLEDLYLDNNHIKALKIDVFRDLKNLKILNLSQNKIENLEHGLFDNLISLEILDIGYNLIKILDEELLNYLLNLRKFWLNENKIDWWEVRGIKMYNPNLIEINLMWNDWICDDLAFIVKHLEIQNITLYKDDSVRLFGTSVKGLPCVHEDTLCAN